MHVRALRLSTILLIVITTHGSKKSLTLHLISPNWITYEHDSLNMAFLRTCLLCVTMMLGRSHVWFCVRWCWHTEKIIQSNAHMYRQFAINHPKAVSNTHVHDAMVTKPVFRFRVGGCRTMRAFSTPYSLHDREPILIYLLSHFRRREITSRFETNALCDIASNNHPNIPTRGRNTFRYQFVR